MQQSAARGNTTLIGRMRALLDGLDYSENVKKAWLYWARCFLLFHEKRSPESLGLPEIEAFLDHLDQQRQVSPASRRQALKATRLLLVEVLDQQIDGLEALCQRERRRATPVILSPSEVQELLSCLKGADWLMASLVYGAGLRLMECLRLRVRDLDSNRIIVRDANARFARETVLPDRVREPMRVHLEDLKLQHIRQLADGFGQVQLPRGTKTPPAAARSWSWQFVFPGPYLADLDHGKGGRCQTHMSEPEARQIIAAAAREAGIRQPVSGGTLRNSFAVHLIRRGVAVCDVERLLGIDSGQSGGNDFGGHSAANTLSPVDQLAAH